MINWNKLRTFYYVAKNGNFTTASKIINLTQSAVSKQISDLEYQLKVRLFTRHHFGLTLTKTGKEWFKVAEEIFNKIEKFQELTLRTRNQNLGPLKLITDKSFLDSTLRHYIPGFLEKYPNIKIDLVGSNKEFDYIVQEADVAILPFKKRRPKYVQQLLMVSHLGLFASKQYLKKFGTPQSIKDLEKHRLIGMGEDNSLIRGGNFKWILTLGKSKGQYHTPYAIASSVQSLVHLAQEGVGIISAFIDWTLIKKSSLVPILPNDKSKQVEFYYIYSETLKDVKKIHTLYHYLKNKMYNV